MTDADAPVLAAAAAQDLTDKRIRAAFLVCPALGPVLSRTSLRGVARPVAVRWGDADEIAPPEANARVYADGIPGADARSLGADVRHEHFIGNAPEGSEARERAAADAVAFFREHLA